MSSMRRSVGVVALSIAVVFAGCQGFAAAQEAGPASGAEAKVWQPRPAAPDAPVRPARVRIVDFGTDFLRDGDGRPVHQFAVHRYRLELDRSTGLWSPVKDLQLDLGVDVDGDGRSDDDCVAYYPFSLERPFSPEAPWYDSLAGTPRWYGGAAIYQANIRETGFSESGVNHEHDGPRHYPRDNWALFHEGYEIDSPYRLAGLWLWLKHDFLNGGADNKVAFEAGSELALYLQRYFMGVDGVRFVIRDGEQFYISEAVFRGAGQVRGGANGKQHVLCPSETRWAEYNPQAPHDIHFNAAGSTFAERLFEDVTAVGFYAYKDKFVPGYFGYKWYAFETDAVVRRPERPSESIDMVRVDSADRVPEFYMSTCEVPYELWKNVFRLARSNTFVRDPRGFIFDRDGDMGSMDFPGPGGRLVPHSPQEPVTDVTLHDVAAWCNALSVQESRTPCYYEDPEFSTVFRFVLRSPLYGEQRPLPKLYVRWDADGYRLPTPSEWQSALAGLTASPDTAWVADNSEGRTQPVGRKPANAGGLHDMLGNVWELVWTAGNAYDPAESQELTALGGDFRHPMDPRTAAANPYGDVPFDGSYNVGFRIVRREPGLAPPADRAVGAGVPGWVLKKGDRVAPSRMPIPDPTGLVETVKLPDRPVEIATHEISFALWKRICNWAAGRGYSFDHDGDMGSMDYWGFGDMGRPHPHSPDEPVTDITTYDAMVWCNALSEVEGRRPVYYADKELTKVYRKAFVYRPLMMLFFEAGKADEAGIIRYSSRAAYEDVYVRADADGYRLPDIREFNHATTAGKGTRFSWGAGPEGGADYAWLFDTAQGTTHPVGRKKPNALGLYDMEGNVSEISNDAGKGWALIRMGGSFEDLTVGLRPDNPPFSPRGWGYPDIGFRVVRQVPAGRAALSAPAASPSLAGLGPRPGDVFTAAPRALALDPARFDPLQGRVYRANLRRDGVFDAPGIVRLTGLKWKFKTGGPIKSSPVVVDGIAYFGSDDGHIYAVDAGNGRQVWKVRTGDKVTGSAAVVDGTVYIAGQDGNMYALDARTGDTKWTARFSQERPSGSPAVAYGVVIIPTGNGGGNDTVLMSAGGMVGLDVETGRPVWRSPSGPQGYGAPTIMGDTVWAGVGGSNWGAFDLATGTLKRSWHMSGQSRQFTTAAAAGELVYVVGTIGGDVAAMHAQKLRMIWKQFTLERQTSIRNDGLLGYEVFTSPAVAHDRVYVGCNDGKLHTFDALRGDRGWTFQAGGKIHSSPAVAGNVVCFGCHDGWLYALDAVGGELLWKFQAGDRIISSPWPTDGVVYFGCDDGHLYAVAGESKEGG